MNLFKVIVNLIAGVEKPARPADEPYPEIIDDVYLRERLRNYEDSTANFDMEVEEMDNV